MKRSALLPAALLLLVAAAATSAAAIDPTTTSSAAAATITNLVPGSVDAPVDNLDGKPHTGPGLYDMREKGSGSVGISSGRTHVDLKNPPPHTGDHEIVDLEDAEVGEKDGASPASKVSRRNQRRRRITPAQPR